MGTHLLNVTGRKKIIHAKSGNTEIIIRGEKTNDGANITVELKLNKKHQFPDHAIVTLYPYQQSGGALFPINLGTISKPEKLEEPINIIGADIENLLFRLKVSDKRYILGLADEISLYDDDKGLSKKGSTTALLPVLTDDISTPFKIKMSPNNNRPPILIINKKSNIRLKLASDPYTMIIIYSAAVREILTNFLINPEYLDDRWKDEWIKFIHIAQGEPEKEYPKPYFIEDEEFEIDRDTVEWIDDAVSTISNLKLKDYENKTLMEILIEGAQNQVDVGGDVNEN